MHQLRWGGGSSHTQPSILTQGPDKGDRQSCLPRAPSPEAAGFFSGGRPALFHNTEQHSSNAHLSSRAFRPNLSPSSPIVRVLKVLIPRLPAPQFRPLGTSQREGPSSLLPAGGALLKGCRQLRSCFFLGPRMLAPGSRGQVPETDPQMPVPAAWNCTCRDRAAWRRRRRGCRRVRALSEARAGPRPARRARQHRARTRVPGRRQPREGLRPEREGMGSWSALEALLTNARSSPGSAQTDAPGAATEAKR